MINRCWWRVICEEYGPLSQLCINASHSTRRTPPYSFHCQRWKSILMTEGFRAQFRNCQGGEMGKSCHDERQWEKLWVCVCVCVCVCVGGGGCGLPVHKPLKGHPFRVNRIYFEKRKAWSFSHIKDCTLAFNIVWTWYGSNPNHFCECFQTIFQIYKMHFLQGQQIQSVRRKFQGRNLIQTIVLVYRAVLMHQCRQADGSQIRKSIAQFLAEIRVNTVNTHCRWETVFTSSDSEACAVVEVVWGCCCE